MHEEFFLPGEVIVEEGIAGDQLYFLCDGKLVIIIFHNIDNQHSGNESKEILRLCVI